MDRFRREAGDSATESLIELGVDARREQIREVVDAAINANIPDLGIKSIVDAQKKKVLISQTYNDKPFADILQQMLVFNGVPLEDILYTNSDDQACRIPEGQKVYEYLREFFVESYSTQKIMVLFVTSENTTQSWGAVTEVGASWITQIDHKIFNIRPFRPEHPLNDEAQWQTTNRDGSELWVDPLNADILCEKIESACETLDYGHRSRAENRAHLETLISVHSPT
jgi:hypothetical protein